MSQFADFTPLVLKKKEPVVHTHYENRHKVEEETENFAVKAFDKAWIQRLIKFRTEKGWKQDEFANKLQVPASAYKQLEANKLPYDAQLVQKINNKMSKM